MTERKPLSMWHILLIYYLQEKNTIIRNLVGMDYITNEDIEEIKEWSEKSVKLSLSNIGKTSSDIDNCPWCARFNTVSKAYNETSCLKCNYKNRHGSCIKNSNGDYSKIITSLRKLRVVSSGEGVSTVLGIKELLKNIRCTFKTMKNAFRYP